MGMSAELVKKIKDFISQGYTPLKVETRHGKRFVVFDTNGQPEPMVILAPVVEEDRSVLLVDLVAYSKRSLEEQLVLAQTMNRLFGLAEQSLLKRHSGLTADPYSGHLWTMYKGTGDGAIFAFGSLNDPGSIRTAIAYATWVLKVFAEHNAALRVGALNKMQARMAIAYGDALQTDDLAGNIDIVGEAINVAARLASSDKATEGCHLLEEAIYHNIQVNKSAYMVNDDKSLPSSGDLSDFVLGVRPNKKNYLYLENDGIHTTKDRKLRAYNVAGCLDGVEVRRTV